MPRRLVNNQKRFFMRGICVEQPITFHKTIITPSLLYDYANVIIRYGEFIKELQMIIFEIRHVKCD